MHEIWHVSSTRKRPVLSNREIHNPRWPPAAILKCTETRITPEPLIRFSPNWARSFALTPSRHRKSQNRNFSKSKMAAYENPKFTKIWIISKRFGLYAPNLARFIYSSPERSPCSQNREIHNPRWPTAAILKFTETWITPEPLVQFSPNLARSFALTPSRHRKCQRPPFFKIQDGHRRKTEIY